MTEKSRLRLARSPLAVAILSALLLAAAGLGARAGVWHFRVGFQLLRDAMFLGAIAALVALALLAFAPAVRRGHVGTLFAALVVGAFVAYLPWHWMQKAKAVPPIHDITTDTENPPQFVAILPLRKDAPNAAEYGGPKIADEQKKAYPDVRPIHLAEAPADAFGRALAAAKRMRWRIVAADPAAGRLEATDTTTWFGFKDDVVVRIAAESQGSGSRVDVRSVSRVGKSDVGKNAERIRDFVAQLKGGEAAPMPAY